MARKGYVSHDHAAVVHRHDHVHITHYSHAGARGVEHLTAMHAHEHDHSAVQHAHIPHEDFGHEHRREAHIHDHAHPVA